MVMDRDEQGSMNEVRRDAERRNEEFLAMLAHELRNPLVPLRNAIEMLRRVEPREPRTAYACTLADRQIGYLTRLIDELLDASRLFQGRILLKKEVFDLGLLVRQAAEDMRQELAARRHRLSLCLPAEPLWVEGDTMRLLLAIGHLLDNAARYTSPGGHIELELEATATEGLVRVRDDGIGLSPELLRRVFDLFVQGERPLDRAPGGLGLGLSLVRKVVELHGGRVEASSAGGGRGAEFSLYLPRRGDSSRWEQAEGKNPPAITGGEPAGSVSPEPLH
jgi:signal transduction histidine kinase